MIETCYACLRRATSQEHVPPRCLFPHARDVPDGRDYRRNLITVPSCDEHNTEKSTDDEFFRLVLCTALGANGVAMLQVDSKIARSIARAPGLAQGVLREGRDVLVKDSATGALHEATLVPIDAPRLTRVLELIARGLLLHCIGQRWDRDVSIHCELLTSDGGAAGSRREEARRFLHEAANEIFADSPDRGDNPDVFAYRLQRAHDGYYGMRLLFYGGFRVTALFPPEDKGGIYEFPV